MKRTLEITVLALLAAGVAACGGGDSTAPPAAVESVTITPSNATIPVGQVEHFTAKALDGNGHQVSGVSFTWNSSNTGIATVSSDGSVQAAAPGTAQITASASGVTSSAATLVVELDISGSYGLESVGGDPVPSVVSTKNGTTVEFLTGALVFAIDGTFNASFSTRSTDPNGTVTTGSAGSHGRWTLSGTSDLTILVHDDQTNTDRQIDATFNNGTITFIDPESQKEFVFSE